MTKLLIGLACAGLLAQACGGSASSSPAPAPAGTTSTAGGPAVHLSDFMIMPMTLSAAAGSQTFAVTNDGPTPHNLTIADGSGRIVAHSRDLKPHESERLAASLPAGAYTIYCSLPGHKSLGMQGVLTVA